MSELDTTADGGSARTEPWSPTLREIADELLEYQRVEMLDAEWLTTVPPVDFSRLKIIISLTKAFCRAGVDTGRELWSCSGGLLWEFADGSGHFALPDLAVARPGGTSSAQLRAKIVLPGEVTSPSEPRRTSIDRNRKPRWYAGGGVPFYLLVDQEHSSWTLHDRHRKQGRYKVHSSGRYGQDGDPINLPEPFGFSIPTTGWPPYVVEPDSE